MPVLPRFFAGKTTGKVGVKVINDQGVLQNLTRFGFTAQAQLYTAMMNSLFAVEAEAKRLIAHGYYQPAIDTGRLRNSINSQLVEFSTVKVEGKVGTAVYYGIYVHEGTRQDYGHGWSSGFVFGDVGRGDWHMPPRPFLVDALENEQGKIMARFKKAFTRLR